MRNVFDFLKEKEAGKYIEAFKEWLNNQSYDLIKEFSASNDIENTAVRVNGYVYKNDDRTLQAINYLYQNKISFDYTAENVGWSGASCRMEGIIVQGLSFDVQYSGSQTNVRLDLVVKRIQAQPGNNNHRNTPYFTIAPSTSTDWARSYTTVAGSGGSNISNMPLANADTWTTMASTPVTTSTMEMTPARTSYATATSLDADSLVSGITAEIRATPQPGQLRMNEETGAFEFYNNNDRWQRIDVSALGIASALPSHTHEAQSTGTVGYIN